MDLKYCAILKEIILKTVAEKKLFIFVFVFYVVLFYCPKRLKLPNGLTKSCNSVHKNYVHILKKNTSL